MNVGPRRGVQLVPERHAAKPLFGQYYVNILIISSAARSNQEKLPIWTTSGMIHLWSVYFPTFRYAASDVFTDFLEFGKGKWPLEINYLCLLVIVYQITGALEMSYIVDGNDGWHF